MYSTLRPLIGLMVVLAAGGCSAQDRTSMPNLGRAQPAAWREPTRLRINWTEVARRSAAVEVLNMEAAPFSSWKGKNGWLRIPSELRRRTASVYMPVRPSNGVADFEITRS